MLVNRAVDRNKTIVILGITTSSASLAFVGKKPELTSFLCVQRLLRLHSFLFLANDSNQELGQSLFRLFHFCNLILMLRKTASYVDVIT